MNSILRLILIKSFISNKFIKNNYLYFFFYYLYLNSIKSKE